MFVRGCGTVLLLLAAAYYSNYAQYKEKRICKLLEELCGLFASMQKNIECYTLPLVEICRLYSGEELENLGFFKAWQKGAFTEAMDTLSGIPETIQTSLHHYAIQAGKGDKETELHLCRGIRQELEEALTVHTKEMQAKNKLYRTLPYLTVLSVVLLLT